MLLNHTNYSIIINHIPYYVCFFSLQIILRTTPFYFGNDPPHFANMEHEYHRLQTFQQCHTGAMDLYIWPAQVSTHTPFTMKIHTQYVSYASSYLKTGQYATTRFNYTDNYPHYVHSSITNPLTTFPSMNSYSYLNGNLSHRKKSISRLYEDFYPFFTRSFSYVVIVADTLSIRVMLVWMRNRIEYRIIKTI